VTIGAYDIDRTFTNHARELDALDRSVSELCYNLDELSQDQDTLKQRVSVVETDGIEPLRSSITDLDDATQELRGELAQTRTVVHYLAGRLEWLEHHIRASAGLTVVAIDEADPALQDLASKADLAAAARAGMLPDLQRNLLQAQIRRYDNLHRQRHQQLATAVTHSEILTRCPDSGDEHAAASAAFRAAVGQANQLADQINSSRDDVSNVRARLAASEEYRSTHAATIAEGEQAKVVLHRKLRQRIIDAIGNRALFPAWFTTVLGYGPPAEGTTQWIVAASELIAYRITYAITDPAVALGPRPDPDQVVRAAWYNSLTSTLRSQRQWP
jgi:chromosome segregation ATPase